MMSDTNITTATASLAAVQPSLSLWQSLLDRAKAASSDLAILAPHRSPLTSGDLLEHVARVGAALRSHGIGPADSVAVALPNGPEMATAFIAIATHAACAPLNPGYRRSEFEHYLDDLKPKALVMAPGTITPARQAAAALSIPVIDLVSDDAGPAGNFVLPVGPFPDLEALPAQAGDVALLLHTSGTTSRPKLVQLTQRNVLVSAANIADSLRLRPADRCLNIMPLFHIHGLIGATLSTIASGGSLVCTRGLNVVEFFPWLEQFQPSWYSAVPTMHQSMLARARDTGIRRFANSLRLIRSSSSPMPTRVMTGLEQLFGVPVVESYGMTEAAHQIACNPLPPAERKCGSVGVPAGPEIAVLDDSGARLGPEQIGEIVVRGPNVTEGYRANPDANAASILPDGWFRTGDLGRFDANGYLYITGRTKEMINRGGEKVAPREVEEALMEHAAVVEAVVFSMPHARLGEDVGAAVTLQDGQTVTERALRNFVAARLADFKVPRRILFLPELPKGATGKPQRIGLAERLGIIDEPIPQPEIAPEDAMPQTKTELRVAACWMRTLKREAISLHANFFDIGGDSLAALTLVADLEREMGVLIDVMEHPTIAAMAAVLEEGGEQASQRLYSIKAQGARPPLFLIGAGPLFRNLSLRLDPEQPVLSAVLLDYSRMPVPCRVEDIAAFHVETIRSVQQHGPYALGGWCVDSIAAYEAARQLRALGEEVELLILFDPLAPQGFVAGGKWSWLIRRTRFHLGQLRAPGGPQARQYALDRWHTVWRKITRRLIQLRYRIGLRPSDPSKTYIPAETYIRNALAIQHLAGARYRPSPYDGRTLILRSVEKVTAEGDLSGTKWAQSISGPIETHFTSGHHRSMLLPPEVDQTADLVESSLRAARNRGCG